MLSRFERNVSFWVMLALHVIRSNMADVIYSTTSETSSLIQNVTACISFESNGPGRGALIGPRQVVHLSCSCYSDDAARPECPVWTIAEGHTHLILNSTNTEVGDNFCRTRVLYHVQPNETETTGEVVIRCSVPGLQDLQEAYDFRVKEDTVCSSFKSIAPANGAVVSPWQIVEASCWCFNDESRSRRPQCPLWSITKGGEHLLLNSTQLIGEESFCKSVVRYYIQLDEDVENEVVAIRCSVPGNKLKEDYQFNVKGPQRSIPSSRTISNKKDMWIYLLLAIAGAMFIASILGVIIQHRRRQRRSISRRGAYRKGQTAERNSVT